MAKHLFAEFKKQRTPGKKKYLAMICSSSEKHMFLDGRLE
jgi:hypothetical protein